MTQAAEDPVLHILWMNGGLGCDGDSVALTAATQPSIEEIVLGALPGLPKVAVHWPLIDFECGPEQGADNFIEWWHKADRGELDPFVLVVEGSIPNEAIKSEGYWCGFGNDPATGQPMTTSEWLDRLAETSFTRMNTGQIEPDTRSGFAHQCQLGDGKASCTLVIAPAIAGMLQDARNVLEIL